MGNNWLVNPVAMEKMKRFRPENLEELKRAVDTWCKDVSKAKQIYGTIGSWDVSLVTNMNNLFEEKTTFDDDLNNWDVSSVTDMSDMFWKASSFNQDISSWDVSSVTNMSSMFFRASSF